MAQGLQAAIGQWSAPKESSTFTNRIILPDGSRFRPRHAPTTKVRHIHACIVSQMFNLQFPDMQHLLSLQINASVPDLYRDTQIHTQIHTQTLCVSMQNFCSPFCKHSENKKKYILSSYLLGSLDKILRLIPQYG